MKKAAILEKHCRQFITKWNNIVYSIELTRYEPTPLKMWWRFDKCAIETNAMDFVHPHALWNWSDVDDAEYV